MAKLIYKGEIREDDWQVVPAEAGELPAGRIIVPLARWQAEAPRLAARGEIGVWLGPDDEPSEIAAELGKFAVIAVEFPKFSDGRGYSTAALLRTRYAYAGELRAIGEVLRDQFFYLTRCGFDALQPAEGRYSAEQLQQALAALKDFSEPYQGAVDQPEPVWRRRARGELAA